MTDYKVIREHVGDKPYKVGDTRKAEEREVRHLIGKCLVKAGAPAKAKAAKPLLNKASGK